MINMEKKVQTSPGKSKKNKRTYLILIAILLFIVLINSGYLRYQSLVIGSNSMKNYMEKGDVILVDQQPDINKIKIK